MRLLITGAGGQLGLDVGAAAVELGHDVVGLDRASLDVTDREVVLRTLGDVRPEVVLNAAAWTAVDDCEADPDRAFSVNAAAVDALAGACRSIGAHLVQVSTDYVFDGDLDRPYVETDEARPVSVYGASKLAGEQAAAQLGDGALVVRTSWLAGEHGSNIVTTVLRLAAERAGDRGALAFVDDQRGCPTFTADLAPVLVRLADERRCGTLHVTNQGTASWYELARRIVVAAGGDPALVRPIQTSELDPPRPAQRPANSVLDNSALLAAGIPLLRDFDAPLAELVDRLR